jgi:uncharacterized OsmC-like protein
MTNLNNVNVDSLSATVTRLKNDLATRKMKQMLSGEWNLTDPSQPQFSSVLKTERGGEFKLVADQPTPQGGNGLAPGPVPFCLYGIASCFAATLATNAALENTEISRLKVNVTADMNMSRVFGLSEEPIMERVTLLVELELAGGAKREVLQRLIDLAEQRCPAAYTLTRGTKLEVQLV